MLSFVSNLLLPNKAGARQTRYRRPDNHTHGQVDTRSHAGKQHVTRDLRHHVSDDKDRNSNVEVVPRHAEIRLEVVQARLCERAAVDVV